MKTQYKHIEFERIKPEKKRKTLIFICRNHNFENLGYIEWNNGWRQYCFSPEEECVFSKSCLEDINHFIQQLMDDRK